MTRSSFIELSGADDARLQPFRWRDRELDPRLPRPEAPHGWFIAEGDLVVERALAAGYEPVAVLADLTRRPAVLDRVPGDVPVFVADAAIRRIMTGLSVTLDVVGLFHRRPPAPIAELVERCRRVVVVQEVDNPSNLGTIIRSAVALGIDGLVVDRTSADPLARRSARVSMGTVFGLKWARTDELPAGLEPFRSAGVRLLGLTPSPVAQDLARIELGPDERAALLFGSERNGLSEAVLAAVEPVRIPMHDGVDSLNVAAAASIACYVFGSTRAASWPGV
ncbi:MAG: RNA methyltransferase [Ilumatobacteraceae bacterium]